MATEKQNTSWERSFWTNLTSLFLSHAIVTTFYFSTKLLFSFKGRWMRHLEKMRFLKSSLHIFKKIFSLCLEGKAYKDFLEHCGFWRSSIKAPTSFIQLPKEERNKYPESDTVYLVFDNNSYWMNQMTFWGLLQNSLALNMKYMFKICFWQLLIFGKEKKRCTFGPFAEMLKMLWNQKIVNWCLNSHV